MRVDAHHHLWDTSEREYPRLSGPGTEPLWGRFDTGRLEALARREGFGATVVVEAATDLRETRDLLSACAGSTLIAGVVGWVDLTDPGVHDVLAELAEGPGELVAVRHPAEIEPDPDWLLRPEVLRGIAAAGAAGLAFDLLVTPAQLPAAEAAARSLPEVRFVLDHLGKPPIAGAPSPDDSPWAARTAALARLPHVSAKLSGLVTEADWTRWRPEHLAPYVHRALDLFGPDRLMFGSDWPVCTLAADHSAVVRTAEDLLAGLSPTETDQVMGGTARQWYRLD
ncbi:amidohydrolase [Nocardiopsis sp. YSL2]|uniref:amidohydrolase family protein n=1 Tax=Nocardiopsis sp. YSL2 TaxID=2939492 RepID=UPI0026F46323|nr:amidohydrolase family protein [Nocardiopsis sp. YSL2]